MVTSSKKKFGSYLTHTAAYLCKILLHVHQSFKRYGGGAHCAPPPQCYRALKSPVLIGLKEFSIACGSQNNTVSRSCSINFRPRL